MDDESDCQACLPGHYCDVPGLDSPAGECEAGYFCSGGSNSSRYFILLGSSNLKDLRNIT